MLIVAVLGASPRFASAAGMVAGRGVLRAQRAVVLHRDAAVWAAAGDRGGGRVRAGGLCVVICFTRHLRWASRGWARFSSARACLAAPFLWVSMEFAFMHLAGHRISVESARVRGGRKSCVCAIDGDHRNFRAVAGGRVLQRAGGLGRRANVAAQAGRHDAVDRRRTPC